MKESLSYCDCNEAGLTRRSTGKGFLYYDCKKKITDAKTIDRINSIKIPPAWENVWICLDPAGHIQATGCDVKGRKQYLYHPSWIKRRKIEKFNGMQQFGKKLPLLLKQVKSDLRKRSLNQEKICAFAVLLMSETFMRIGNKNYEKDYGSFGLTTLKNRHISLRSNTVFIKFVGKKGVKQQIKLTNSQLSNLIKKMKDLPGQNLFQYYDDNQAIQQLNSGHINHYLKEILGIDISSKDFRTWGASSIALYEVLSNPIPKTLKERENALRDIIQKVALKLGNTVAVAKKYYVHPKIQQSFLNGTLDSFIQKNAKKIQAKKNDHKLRLLLLELLD